MTNNCQAACKEMSKLFARKLSTSTDETFLEPWEVTRALGLLLDTSLYGIKLQNLPLLAPNPFLKVPLRPLDAKSIEVWYSKNKPFGSGDVDYTNYGPSETARTIQTIKQYIEVPDSYLPNPKSEISQDYKPSETAKLILDTLSCSNIQTSTDNLRTEDVDSDNEDPPNYKFFSDKVEPRVYHFVDPIPEYGFQV